MPLPLLPLVAAAIAAGAPPCFPLHRSLACRWPKSLWHGCLPSPASRAWCLAHPSQSTWPATQRPHSPLSQRLCWEGCQPRLSQSRPRLGPIATFGTPRTEVGSGDPCRARASKKCEFARVASLPPCLRVAPGTPHYALPRIQPRPILRRICGYTLEFCRDLEPATTITLASA